MRDQTEVDAVLSKAAAAEGEPSRWPAMTYEDGVAYALGGSWSTPTRTRWRTEMGKPAVAVMIPEEDFGRFDHALRLAAAESDDDDVITALDDLGRLLHEAAR